jgi:predicted HNH restriction endonuclease
MVNRRCPDKGEDAMNKELFAKLFKQGEVIDSGGPANRENHALLKILEIGEDLVYYQSLKSKSKNHVRYSHIDVIIEGFDRIDPKSIQPSIQQVFVDAGLLKNYSTENYIYGFAREIRRRLGTLEAPFLSSGEVLDDPGNAVQSKAGEPLTEGAFLRVLVDRHERNSEAVRLCKELKGVQCVCCEFDFEKFYGPIGEGFTHVHHLHPMSKTNGAYAVDPAKDLVPLCPNCHAMVHRGKKLLTISELKKQIESARKILMNNMATANPTTVNPTSIP